MRPTQQSFKANPVRLAEPIDSNRRQWVMLLPAGTIKTKDSRGPYRLDNPEMVIQTSFAYANTGDLPVDTDHAIDHAKDGNGKAPASGWITELQSRADGVWGLIEWTPKAAEAIESREYRFISPVIAHSADKRVLAILRASLTNDPNLTLTALNSAQGINIMDEGQFHGELRNALGLDTTADQDALINAVRDLAKSKNSADPAKFVPIGTFQLTVAELNKLRSGVSLQAAESIVAQAVQTGKILPFMSEWAVSLCQANKAAFDDFLDGAGKPITNFISTMTTTSHLDARGPSQSPQLTEVSQMLGHSADDLKKYGEGIAK